MTGSVARPLRALVSAFACLAVLVGCASRGYQAPVTDLSPPPSVRAPNATVPPPAAPDAAPVPTYVVKPGDTLYSIAQKFGQDYRQIAAWNALDPSYHIQVNQVLRVGPPEPLSSTNVAESSPVGTSSIEQRPLGAPGAASSVAPPAGPPPPAGPAPLVAPGSPVGAAGAAATNDAPMKTGPLGLKRPYSDATLAELSRPDSGTDASAAAPGAASSPQSAPQSGAPPGPPPPGLPPAQPAAAASDSSGDLPAIGWIWPAKGPLLSEFNDPKNKGIDIAGKMGDPIVASGSGTVIYVGQGLRGLGNLVVVKHTEGLISVYAHNSKILVANNQPVKKGDQIAEMGNSDSEKVELHFEIRRQGAPVDPLKFLPSR